jgi:hypothetical protein
MQERDFLKGVTEKKIAFLKEGIFCPQRGI